MAPGISYASLEVHPPDSDTFWGHALRTANACRDLAARANAGRTDPEQAYATGLLHDVGQIGLANADPAAYGEVLDASGGDEGVLLEVEREAFGVDHPTYGAWILRSWQLPESLAVAVERHHHPETWADVQPLERLLRMHDRFDEAWMQGGEEQAQATRENERQLETRIAVRTAELNRANERLRTEATDREQLMEQLRKQEEHLRFMAQHDALTGLPNRTSMQQRLALALELAKRNRKKVAVMMVDLDEFKRINDTRGHPAGDQALVQLAARLRTSVRGSDTVARYGGDEFVILAGELDRAEDAAMVAEKVGDMVSVPMALEGGPASIGCSIGISVYPDYAEDAEALIALADKAMYASKSLKDRRYAFYGAAG